MKGTRLTLKDSVLLQTDELREQRRVFVCAIQPGPAETSFRGRQVYISAEAIQDLVPLIKEHTIMLANHEDRDTREFHIDTVSWVAPETVRLAKADEFEDIAEGSLVCEVEFSTNSATSWMYDDLLRNLKRFELSFAGMVVYEFKKIGGVEYAYATKILAHMSLDWVDYGAAGGVVLAASRDDTKYTKEEFREFLKIEERFKVKLTEKPELLNLRDVIDEINLDIIYKCGTYLLNYFFDVLYWTETPFDEMEKMFEKAIDDVFELIKDMDIIKTIGAVKPVEEDGTAARADMVAALGFAELPGGESETIKTIFATMLTHVYNNFDEENLESVECTLPFYYHSNEDGNVDDANRVRLWISPLEPKTQTEEENALDLKEVQEFLRGLGEKERNAGLAEFIPSTTELEESIITLKAENLELVGKVEVFETARANAEAEIALNTAIAELLKTEEIATVDPAVLMALKALPTDEARKELLVSIKSSNSDNGSLTLLNQGIDTEKVSSVTTVMDDLKK